MGTVTKTDNAHLLEKLEVRKRICSRLNAPLRVLDLFAGEGHVWKAMGRQFAIESYVPVDKRKLQPGTIRMDVTPRTVRAFDPFRFNVIDLDAYGDPFEIWSAIAPGIKSPTAVFWTFGHLGMSPTSCSYFLRESNGIPRDWPIPVNRDLNIFLGKHFYMRTLCAHGATHGVAVDHPNVSYYGALLGALRRSQADSGASSL